MCVSPLIKTLCHVTFLFIRTLCHVTLFMRQSVLADHNSDRFLTQWRFLRIVLHLHHGFLHSLHVTDQLDQVLHFLLQSAIGNLQHLYNITTQICESKQKPSEKRYKGLHKNRRPPQTCWSMPELASLIRAQVGTIPFCISLVNSCLLCTETRGLGITA